MLVQILKRLEPFRTFDPPKTAVALAHCRLLEVPRGRWLTRRSQPFRRDLYLVAGALTRDGRTVAPGPLPIYRVGEQVDIRTREPSRLVAADAEAMRFLLDLDRLPVAEVSGAEPWLTALLRAPVLRPLPAASLQRLLRAGSSMTGDRAAVGEHPDHVFVVKRGAVRLRDGDVRPGGYFGEEGVLVTGEPVRGARFVGPVDLLRVPGDAIRALIDGYPLPGRRVGRPTRVVDLSRTSLFDVRRLAGTYGSGCDVLIRAGSVGQRALAYAILTQAGCRAVPVPD